MTNKLYRDSDNRAYSVDELSYRAWVAAANQVKDQNWIWRQHELYARINYRRERGFKAIIDVGGEA